MLLDATVLQVTDAVRPGRQLDAAIYRALGWRVLQAREAAGCPWRCRSPWASTWRPLPAPSADRHDASDLFPPGWSWSIGLRGGHPYAWCAERAEIVPGTAWFEASHLTVALAATKAALHAHRAILLRLLA